MIAAASSHALPYADGTFHAALGSPPYWGGVRIYSGPQAREWPAISYPPMPGLPPVEIPAQAVPLGHEPDPFAYVGHLLQVYREVRRTMRPEAVLGVNLGDCYSTAPHMNNGKGASSTLTRPTVAGLLGQKERNISRAGLGLPSKNLLLMPWRLALAMQADGWILRSRMPGGVEIEPDVLWKKNSTMPSSARDRPTVDFEDVLLFSQASRYYWDQEAGREPLAEITKSQIALAAKGARGAGHCKTPKERNDGDGNLEAGGVGAAGSRGAGTNPAGRNMRAAWVINPESTDEEHYACVDDGVEMLTARGWKRHDELIPWERVAEYDPRDGSLSWGVLRDVHVYDLDGEEATTINLTRTPVTMTPNHRNVVVKKDGRRHIVRADKLRRAHQIVVAGQWRDRVSEPVSVEMAELLGWHVAEGHEHKAGRRVRVSIYQSQSANPAKVARIEELLQAVGADYRRADRERMGGFGNQTQAVEFAIRGTVADQLHMLAPRKRLQWQILDWSAPLLEALLDGLIAGDGVTRTDGRRSFIQKSRSCIDLVQAVAVRLGYSTRVKAPKIPGRPCFVLYLSRKTSISLRGTNSSGSNRSGKTIARHPYTGTVWCPEVSTGAWVARKDGRVFITGNSWPRELAARLIRVTTSERGCCPECGAPWERVVERTQGDHEASTRPKRTAGMDSPTSTLSLSGVGSVELAKRGGKSETLGWTPTCPHEAEPVPCLVLDPFAGLGRTWEAARETGRRFAGADLSLEYCWTARSRNILEAAARRRAAEAKRPRTITGPLFEPNPL